MKEHLHGPLKIEVRPSRVDGYGVFAWDNIPKGRILEECYYVAISSEWNDLDHVLKQYVFSYDSHEEIQSNYKVVNVLGYGMIYNHSNNPNVCYERDHKNKIFIFRAKKNIKKDEELFIDYGPLSLLTK